MRRGRTAYLAALLAGFSASCDVFPGRRGTTDLTFAGVIEARDVDVGSLVGGRVEKVLVDEGAIVTKREPLVLIESDLLDRQIEQERGTVEAQKANLAKTVNGSRSEEILRAEVDWKNAEKNLERSAALFKQDLASRQQYDADGATAKMLEQTYRELEHGNRPEDIAQARAQLAAEEGRLAYLLRQREELVVRAPADGVIQTMDLRPGDLVAPNQGIVSIVEPDQIWVRIYVPEPRLGRVHVGQAAAIAVDTFPGRSFHGRIVEIRTQAEYTPRNIQTLDQRTDQVFGVKVAIDPAPELKPGMAAQVRLSEP